ncbi:MAG: DUF2798 domain-containing protein [Candidatus Aenigmatarchaeota archaeon]
MKKSDIIFAFLMSILMSFFMSIGIALINFGFREGLFFVWIRGFLIGLCIGFPVSIFIVPVVRKAVSKIVKE